MYSYFWAHAQEKVLKWETDVNQNFQVGDPGTKELAGRDKGQLLWVRIEYVAWFYILLK